MSFGKKTIFLALVFVLIVCQVVVAESERYLISDMTNIGLSRWENVYQAYGRTIDVNVKIDIPQVSVMPVLKVRKADPIAEPLYSELQSQYRELNKKDKINEYRFESSDYWTYIEYAIPPVGGKTKKDLYDPINMRTNEYDLIEYNIENAYADNNSLTVKEAFDISESIIKQFFPDVEGKMDTIWVSGKTYWKKSGKVIQEKGAYVINVRQCMRGIPIMGQIRETYTQRGKWEINWNSDGGGSFTTYIYDENAWRLIGYPYQEINVVRDNVTLYSFEDVKDKVESLITSGYIRWINTVTLGYIQFETEEPKEQILLPCWVIWCEYHPDGPNSEVSYGINDSALMFDGNNEYYRPIIINACTGELYDSLHGKLEDCLCPDLSTWN